jgi:hypothetical protein
MLLGLGYSLLSRLHRHGDPPPAALVAAALDKPSRVLPCLLLHLHGTMEQAIKPDTPELSAPLDFPPQSPGQWTLKQIQDKLSRPLPASMLEHRIQGKQKIAYIPWHTANTILDKYAPGWTWEIRQLTTTSDRLFVVGRLTLPTADGDIWRESTGTELLKEEKAIMVPSGDRRVALVDEYDRPVTEPKEIAYGDPSSNAESMAFRRCAARFGLGLYLKKKD